MVYMKFGAHAEIVRVLIKLVKIGISCTNVFATKRVDVFVKQDI